MTSRENEPRPMSSAGHDYDGLFDRLEQRIGEEVARSERDRRAAGGLLAELLAGSRRGRLEAVREDARYRSPALVQALLAAARSRRPGQVAEALHWARLAYVAAATPGILANLRRTSLLEIAEALRLAGKLRWAALCLRALTADLGFTLDPDEHARLCLILAQICRDRGRGARALGLYMRAVTLYGEVGNFTAAAQVRREMRTLLGSLSD